MAWCLRELAALLEDYLPTWLLTNVCNSSFGESDAFSEFCKHCAHMALRHIPSNTHKTKEKNKEEVK